MILVCTLRCHVKRELDWRPICGLEVKSCGALGSMDSTAGTEKREPWTPSVQGRCFSSSGGALVGEGALGTFCPCHLGSGWREWGAGVASDEQGLHPQAVWCSGQTCCW